MKINTRILSIFSTLAAICAVTVWLGGAAPANSDLPARNSNEPPVCIIDAPQAIGCQGMVTNVVLDASQSHDPEGAPLTFTWTNGCPGASFDDPTSATPTLSVDTSMSCDLGCWVRLRLSDGKRYTFCRFFINIVGTPELGLDIKPGSCPNPINTGSNGVVPVSLLGTASFDVSTVVLSSLLLVRADGTAGQVAPISEQFEDTGTPFEGDLCDCHELTGDGFVDLSLKFDKQELVAQLGLDLDENWSFVTLRLVGTLTSGESFFAEDCVRVQGN